MTSDFVSCYMLAIQKENLSPNGVSAQAKLLARVTGENFVNYGQQQKSDRESARKDHEKAMAAVQQLKDDLAKLQQQLRREEA